MTRMAVFMIGLIAMTVAALKAQSSVPVRSARGVISGLVVDETGVGAAGARVDYRMQAKFARDRLGKLVVRDVGASGVATTSADGSFVLDGLPSGRYIVCAFAGKARATNTVSSCQWEPTAVVEVSENGRTEGVTRKLYDGVSMIFRVKDAANRISVADEKGRVTDFGRRFFVGIVNRWGTYLAAQLLVATGEEKRYQVLVPRGEEVRVFIDSDLPVTDSRGVALEKRQISSLVVLSGYGEKSEVELTVP